MKGMLAEWRAAVMVRIANRTFKHRPNRMDRLAGRLVARAAGEAGKSDRR